MTLLEGHMGIDYSSKEEINLSSRTTWLMILGIFVISSLLTIVFIFLTINSAEGLSFIEVIKRDFDLQSLELILVPIIALLTGIYLVIERPKTVRIDLTGITFANYNGRTDISLSWNSIDEMRSDNDNNIVILVEDSTKQYMINVTQFLTSGDDDVISTETIKLLESMHKLWSRQ